MDRLKPNHVFDEVSVHPTNCSVVLVQRSEENAECKVPGNGMVKVRTRGESNSSAGSYRVPTSFIPYSVLIATAQQENVTPKSRKCRCGSKHFFMQSVRQALT